MFSFFVGFVYIAVLVLLLLLLMLLESRVVGVAYVNIGIVITFLVFVDDDGVVVDVSVDTVV